MPAVGVQKGEAQGLLKQFPVSVTTALPALKRDPAEEKHPFLSDVHCDF